MSLIASDFISINDSKNYKITIDNHELLVYYVTSSLMSGKTY